MNATNLAFAGNRVCRKYEKKPRAKARRRKVNELTIFASPRLCVRNPRCNFLVVEVFKNYFAVVFTEKSPNLH